MADPGSPAESATPHADEPLSPASPRPGWATASVLLSVAAASAFVWIVAGRVVALPTLPGRLQADAVTTYLSMIGDLVVRLSAGVTLGALLGVVAFIRPTGRDASSPDTAPDPRVHALARVAAHTGQVWFWASVLQTFAHSAYVNGVPVAYTVRPAAWWDFQSSTPSGLAWLLSALAAAVATAVGYAGRRVAPFALAFGLGVAAWTFVGVTGSVTVGANHDWATDAAIWLTAAIVPVTSAAACVVLTWDADGAARSRLRRYHRLAGPLLVVALAGHAVIAWQQLAGTAPTASLYGVIATAQLAVVALLLLTWLIRAVLRRRAAIGWIVVDAALLIAGLALATAENHVPSPRFEVAQSIQINYLGYEMTTPATIGRLLGLGRPNWLWIGLAVAAVAAYLVALARVKRSGGRWPIQRTIAWVAGWGLMLFLAVTGFWEYSTVVYSWHMFVHMTVNMLVPALCVLGGPLTLLREASTSLGGDALPTARDVLDAVGAHRPLARVFSPPVLWLNYVGSLFVIYYTPLFPWLMRYHWAHQLMLLYFMATGYAFFSMIVGVDKHLNDLPHLVRLALVISIMPFHAIFAVGIMSSRSLIGADFYRAIDVGWVGDLMADQSTAGQITWILGEIPLFIVMIALAAQWFSHDRAENAVSDVAQDSGADDSFDAYNEMLAQLAERDRQSARRTHL